MTRGRYGGPQDLPFTAVPNSTVRDAELSLKATGLLTLLLSHTDGWVTNIERIARSKPDGVSAVRSAMKELEDRGYLVRHKVNDPKTGYIFWEYVWFATPQTKEQVDSILRLSTDGKSTDGLSTDGKPQDIRTPALEKQSKKNTPRDTWSEEAKKVLSQVKSTDGKPLTKREQDLLCDQVEEWLGVGYSPQQLVRAISESNYKTPNAVGGKLRQQSEHGADQSKARVQSIRQGCQDCAGGWKEDENGNAYACGCEKGVHSA